MVAEFGDERVGYMIYELQESRLNIVNLAVKPERRRQGIGTAMINRLKEKLSPRRRTELRITTHEEWLESQLFLRSQGFTATAIERGVFGGADGYVMNTD